MTNGKNPGNLIDSLVIRDLEERDLVFIIGRGFLELARPLRLLSIDERQARLEWHHEVIKAFMKKNQAIAASLSGLRFGRFPIEYHRAGGILGYCIWSLIGGLVRDYDYKRADLLCLFVNDVYRGEEAGKALVKEVARRVKGKVPGIEASIPISPKEVSIRAARFYKSIGFDKIGSFQYGCYDLGKVLSA